MAAPMAMPGDARAGRHQRHRQRPSISAREIDRATFLAQRIDADQHHARAAPRALQQTVADEAREACAPGKRSLDDRAPAVGQLRCTSGFFW
jgi:hypothetical protein